MACVYCGLFSSARYRCWAASTQGGVTRQGVVLTELESHLLIASSSSSSTPGLCHTTGKGPSIYTYMRVYRRCGLRTHRKPETTHCRARSRAPHPYTCEAPALPQILKSQCPCMFAIKSLHMLTFDKSFAIITPRVTNPQLLSLPEVPKCQHPRMLTA